MMMVTLGTVVVVAAAPLPKLAVSPLVGGDGVTGGTVKMVGEAVVSELRRQKSFKVLTHDELQALLSHEQQKQLLGCSDAGCFANLGNAAGADVLVGGGIGKVGASWIITLKIIDVKKIAVAAVADRRVKGGNLDDVLDQLPGLVAELVEGATKQLAAREEAAAATPVTAAPTGVPLPAAWAETPLREPVARDRLRILTDGKKHYLAFLPEGRYGGPLFAGDGEAFFLQRIGGGGADGTGAWDAVFWEPRVRERWRAGLSVKPDKVTLQCGEQTIAYADVGRAEAERLRGKAKWWDVRWQRMVVHIARDDTGTYYLVDQAREPDGNTDYRLFVGTKGKMEVLPLNDVIIDRGSSIFLADRGRLVIKQTDGRVDASWAVGAGQQALTVMDVGDQAPMIYTALGAYRGQRLGTLCDPYLAP